MGAGPSYDKIDAAHDEHSIVTQNPPQRPRTGQMNVNVMPGDNSCLFHSISFTCDGRRTSEELQMKQRLRVATVMLTNSHRFGVETLGISTQQYADAILSSRVWGGAVELGIFSEFFQTEIYSFDVERCILYTFGDNKRYPRRVYLVFYGDHYDVLAFKPAVKDPQRPGVIEFFAPGDTGALLQAKNEAERVHLTEFRRRRDRHKPVVWSGRGLDVLGGAGRDVFREVLALSAAEAKGGGKPWTCGSCTFSNPEAAAKSCSVCGAARGAVSSVAAPAAGAGAGAGAGLRTASDGMVFVESKRGATMRPASEGIEFKVESKRSAASAAAAGGGGVAAMSSSAAAAAAAAAAASAPVYSPRRGGAGGVASPAAVAGASSGAGGASRPAYPAAPAASAVVVTTSGVFFTPDGRQLDISKPWRCPTCDAVNSKTSVCSRCTLSLG